MIYRFSNNFTLVGRTALLYNVFVDQFFDDEVSTFPIMDNYQGNVIDIGVSYKLHDDSTWVGISIVKEENRNSAITKVSEIVEDFGDLANGCMYCRYNPGLNHILPCKVLIMGLTPNTSYDIKSWWKDADEVLHDYNQQTISTLANPDKYTGTVCNGITYNVEVENTEEKAALEQGISDAVGIMNMFNTYNDTFTAVVADYGASGGAYDSSMYYNYHYHDSWNLNEIRTASMHEFAHRHLNASFNDEDAIMKFMEFATGIPYATWAWLGPHNYPVISSNRYNYVEDCLVAAACQLTRS